MNQQPPALGAAAPDPLAARRPLFAATAVLAGLAAGRGGRGRGELVAIAVLCAVVILVAVIDIAVLRCRLKAARGAGGVPEVSRAGMPGQRRGTDPVAVKRPESA